jgi:hypothetical protein
MGGCFVMPRGLWCTWCYEINDDEEGNEHWFIRQACLCRNHVLFLKCFSNVLYLRYRDLVVLEGIGQKKLVLPWWLQLLEQDIDARGGTIPGQMSLFTSSIPKQTDI